MLIEHLRGKHKPPAGYTNVRYWFVTEGVPEIEADISGIRDYSSPLEGMYGPGSRPRIVIEHDAKMRWASATA